MKKLHFMHIHKTGGTSLLWHLEKNFNHTEICPYVLVGKGPTWFSEKTILHDVNECRKYNFFSGHLGWVPRMIFDKNEIDTMTFFRNPIDRIISFYNYFKGNIFHQDNIANQWANFDDFVFNKETGLEIYSNQHTKSFCLDLFYKKSLEQTKKNPSLSWDITSWVKIDLTPNQMFDLAMCRLHECNFVGITEFFDESFEMLCSEYNWLPPKKIPHQNISKIKMSKNSLKQETLERIKELNHLDILLYDEALKIYNDRKKTRFFYERSEIEQKIISVLPPSNEIKLNLEDKFIGSGWDAREGEAPDMFVWSSSTVSSLVFSVKNDADYRINIQIINTVILDLPNKLKLTANDHPISLIASINENGGMDFEGTIPRSALSKGSFLELIFSVPEVICPRDVSDSIDMRTLGFALKGVEIKALEKPLQ